MNKTLICWLSLLFSCALAKNVQTLHTNNWRWEVWYKLRRHNGNGQKCKGEKESSLLLLSITITDSINDASCITIMGIDPSLHTASSWIILFCTTGTITSTHPISQIHVTCFNHCCSTLSMVIKRMMQKNRLFTTILFTFEELFLALRQQGWITCSLLLFKPALSMIGFPCICRLNGEGTWHISSVSSSPPSLLLHVIVTQTPTLKIDTTNNGVAVCWQELNWLLIYHQSVHKPRKGILLLKIWRVIGCCLIHIATRGTCCSFWWIQYTTFCATTTTISIVSIATYIIRPLVSIWRSLLPITNICKSHWFGNLVFHKMLWRTTIACVCYYN